jgi:tetratricopeptide (TPR) repeat protein
MRSLLTSVLAALSAFATGWWTSSPGASGPEADGAALGELWTEIEGLRAELAGQGRRLEDLRRGPAATPAGGPALDEADIAAAVERWRAAHPEPDRTGDDEPASGPRLRPVALPVDVASLSIPELVRLLDEQALTEDQRQQLFEELRQSGRMDEYVAEIERLAAEDPTNPELQVALGNAYLQRLFGANPGPEQGTWAFKSDAAFGRALELDPENWEARFLKAVSLSNWPAFLGKGREAMDHFETLVEQQESLAPRPEFAQTYLFYGNVLAANGDPGEALAVWRRGLSLFPDSGALRDAIATAEREQD